jgi:hypothetical protein
MPAEANLLGIVGTEFIAEKLTVCRTPRLHLAVDDRQTLSAESTASRGVFSEAFTHLVSLTPDQIPVLSSAVVLSDDFTGDRS